VIKDVALERMGSVSAEVVAVVELCLQPGDSVRQNQCLAYVSTDKVEIEVLSPFAGRLIEYTVEVGREYPIGATLARIEAD
jgi:pyruvate dehydrogenase E2 component (dihydrolipoamide acetyltransferase)